MTALRGLRIASAVLALAAASCSTSSRPQGVLRYGLTLAPTGIDPHLNASAELGIPLASVYDTLVAQDADGEFLPALAKSWTVSGDGRDYTFHLRRDVEFHDGAPLNAAAVVANLEYTIEPDHHSQKAAFMLGPFLGAEVVDDATVTLHLAEPYAPLLDSLSQVYLGIASPAALRAWGPQDYQLHQVGSGPFAFVEYAPDDHITLSRFEGYRWAPPTYRRPAAALAGVEFRFFVDLPTRALALESGQVDVIGEVPPHDARRLVDSGDFHLYPVSIPGQPMQILFHLSQSPTEDRRVRQALVLAVDRQAVVDTVFSGMSPVARGPLSADVPGFAEDAAFPEPDPATAASLLEASGWHMENGRRLRAGEPLSLRLIVPNWGSHPEVAQLVAAAWESVGAEVEIEVAAGFGPLREAQARGDYHAIMLNFFGTDPDLLTPFYQTGGLYNWMELADPEVDGLLARGRTATDSAERRRAYARLAQMSRDEAWILPIRDYINLIVAHRRVQGMRFSPQGWFPYLIEFSLAP